MSAAAVRAAIFMHRLRYAAKHHVRKAIDLLKGLGKTLAEAVRIVAALRSAA